MSIFCVQCSWDDVPHLSAALREIADVIPFPQRAARTKGVPQEAPAESTPKPAEAAPKPAPEAV